MLNISNNQTPITFKGISQNNIQKFIPDIDDIAAKKLSKIINSLLPYDILDIVNKNDTNITHIKRTVFTDITIGKIIYSGPDNVSAKIRFLMHIVDKIKKGTLYK